MTRLLALAPSVLTILAGCAAGTPAPETAAGVAEATTPRNVIFLLGDGMGFAQVKAYRFYADDPATPVIEPLPFDDELVGAIATDSIALVCEAGNPDDCVRDPYGVTDSASSATAYATGRDTLIGSISVDEHGERMKTVLQRARQRGKSTGIIATSSVTHASPAAFGAHVSSRAQVESIADQFFDNQWRGQPMVDVLLGGGLAHLRRTDRDVVADFEAAGYTTVFDRKALLATSDTQLLGLFADDALAPAWDRPAATPSLADMTRTALGALSRDEDGFFLFVEGSQVDWAGHENNVVGIVSEMEDFTGAIVAALEFAAAAGDTLVIVTSDHETGGMSIGSDNLYQWNPRPLRGLTMTPAAMTAGFLAGDAALSDYLAPQLPFELTPIEQGLMDAVPRDETQVFAAICTLFDKRTVTGWTTHGHTAVDVPLYVTGPGSERFGGTLENEELGRLLQAIFLP